MAQNKARKVVNKSGDIFELRETELIQLTANRARVFKNSQYRALRSEIIPALKTGRLRYWLGDLELSRVFTWGDERAKIRHTAAGNLLIGCQSFQKENAVAILEWARNA